MRCLHARADRHATVRILSTTQIHSLFLRYRDNAGGNFVDLRTRSSSWKMTSSYGPLETLAKCCALPEPSYYLLSFVRISINGQMTHILVGNHLAYHLPRLTAGGRTTTGRRRHLAARSWWHQVCCPRRYQHDASEIFVKTTTKLPATTVIARFSCSKLLLGGARQNHLCATYTNIVGVQYTAASRILGLLIIFLLTTMPRFLGVRPSCVQDTVAFSWEC